MRVRFGVGRGALVGGCGTRRRPEQYCIRGPAWVGARSSAGAILLHAWVEHRAPKVALDARPTFGEIGPAYASFARPAPRRTWASRLRRVARFVVSGCARSDDAPQAAR